MSTVTRVTEHERRKACIDDHLTPFTLADPHPPIPFPSHPDPNLYFLPFLPSTLPPYTPQEKQNIL